MPISPPATDRLERALVRRFAAATVGGLGTPVVTDYPVEAAAVAVSLVCAAGGPWEDGGSGPGEWPRGEGTVTLSPEQVRVDQRQRDIQYLRAMARRDENLLIPPWMLSAVADLLADAPINDDQAAG